MKMIYKERLLIKRNQIEFYCLKGEISNDYESL
jgi:hypothetical protein